MKRNLRSSGAKSPLRELPRRRGQQPLRKWPSLEELRGDSPPNVPSDEDENTQIIRNSELGFNVSDSLTELNVASNGQPLMNSGGGTGDASTSTPRNPLTETTPQGPALGQASEPNSPLSPDSADTARQLREARDQNRELLAQRRAEHKKLLKAQHAAELAATRHQNQVLINEVSDLAASNFSRMHTSSTPHGPDEPNNPANTQRNVEIAEPPVSSGQCVRTVQFNDSNQNTNPSIVNLETNNSLSAVGRRAIPTGANARSNTDFDRLARAISGLQNAPRPVVLKQTPQKFDGITGSAVIWLKRYEKTALVNHWGDSEKAQYLYSTLTGDARNYIDGKFDGREFTWNEFTDAFLGFYRPPGYETQRRMIFLNLAQEDRESPLAYLNRLIMARNEVKPTPSDEEVIEVAQNGLGRFYASAIIRDTTIEEVRRTLSRVAKINENSKNKFKSNSYQPPAKPNPNTGNPPAKTEPGKAVTPAPAYNPNRPRPLCFNCSKMGHLSTECRLPRNPEMFKHNYMNMLKARNPTGAPGQNDHKVNLPQAKHYNNNKRIKPNNEFTAAKSAEVDAEPGTSNTVQVFDLANPLVGSVNAHSTGSHIVVKDCPQVYILINNIKVKALIDTGGSFSLISADLAMQLNAPITPAQVVLRGVGELRIHSLGSIDQVNIVYDHQVILMPVTIIKSLIPHVILGIDFISSLKLVIDASHRQIDIACRGTAPLLPSVVTNLATEKSQTGIASYKVRPATELEVDLLERKRVDTIPAATLTSIDEYFTARHWESFPETERSLVPNTDNQRGYFDDSFGIDSFAELICSNEGAADPTAITLVPATNPEIYGHTVEPAEFLPYSGGTIEVKLNQTGTGLRRVATHPLCKHKDLRVETGLIDLSSPKIVIICVNTGWNAIHIEQDDILALFETETGEAIEINLVDKIVDLADSNIFAHFETHYAEAPEVEEVQATTITSPGQNYSPEEIEGYLANFNIEESLPAEWREKIGRLLIEYRDRFVFEGDQLGRITLEEHHINTCDHAPINQAPFRVSYFERKAIEEQIYKMLELGIIEPIISPWTSPVVIVSKRDKSLRFCVDYRKLNKITVPDRFPLPRLDDALDLLGKCDTFTTLDACSAYWQIKMSADSVEKTTFTCHLGTYCFKYLPFGLRNAPSTCSRIMAKIFAGENGRNCMVYLDDCISMSKGMPQHLKNLTVLFERMRQYDLKLKPSKCFFAKKSVSYLGHEVTEEGLRPDPERTRTLREFPVPKTVTEVRSFLGFCSFYRRFIQNFSVLASPLNKLLKKTVAFEWTDSQQLAFETLKTKVLEPPVLAHYDPNAVLLLRTDASRLGIAGHLIQMPSYEERKKGQLLACVSRTLSPAETNYSVSELEALAIIFSIDKFRVYLYHQKFIIETDHCSLCYLLKIKNPNGRLCRWALQLQGFEFEIKYSAGKNHTEIDSLSRNPLPASLKDLDKEYFKNTIVQPVLMAYDALPGSEVPTRDYHEPSRIYPFITFEQNADPELKEIIDKVNNLEGEEQIKDNYVIFKDVLYKRQEKGGRVRYLLCVPKSKVRDVIFAHHDSAFSGHIGREKTLANIKSKYHWKTIYDDVAKYVNSCQRCQLFKLSNQRRAGLAQPLPIPSGPLQEIAMDNCGPFKRTKAGNRFILTICCRMSKFAVGIAVPDKSSKTTMQALQDHFLFKYGICKSILSDRATNFGSNYCRDFYAYYGIKFLPTVSYNPEANGQCENLNKFIKTCVSISTFKCKLEWDTTLAEVIYAYNCSVNATTKQSPHFMVFGTEPRLYIDTELSYEELADEVPDEALRNARRALAWKAAIDNTVISQEKNRQYVNKRRRNVTYNVGDKVLLEQKFLKRTSGGAWKPKYTGPYAVLKQINPVVYLICTLTGKYEVMSVHVKRLKKFYAREGEDIDVHLDESSSEEECEEESSSDESDNVEVHNETNDYDNTVSTDTEVYWDPDEPGPSTRIGRRIRRPAKLDEFVSYIQRPLSAKPRKAE